MIDINKSKKAFKEFISKYETQPGHNLKVVHTYHVAENAKELANLLKGMNAYVNLIPYNSTSNDSLFKKSDKERILAFYDTLKKNNISVTIRKEFGTKVMAACGQLRANYEEEK